MRQRKTIATNQNLNLYFLLTCQNESTLTSKSLRTSSWSLWPDLAVRKESTESRGCFVLDLFFAEPIQNLVGCFCGRLLLAMNFDDWSILQRKWKICIPIPIRKVPWEGSKLRRARKEKDNAWHTFNISPSHFNLTSALEAEEKYKIVERKLREDYEKKLIKNVKQNPSRFFAYLRNKKKSNKTASCLRKANGQTTTCPKETADLLVESLVVGLQQR